MRALVAASWLVFTLAASFACGGGEPILGGGTTGGVAAIDPQDCDSVRLEGEGDEPALGFSMTDILAATEGRFDVPVRWLSSCDPTEEESSACDRASTFVEAWAGGETTVHVEITSDGSKAEVRHPTEAQPRCAQGMFIPVELRLESDDGLLDETREATVWSECGTDSSVDFVRPLESAGGALAPSNSNLPPRWSLEFTLGFFLDRMWFGVYLGPSGLGAVLANDLPPFGERTHDAPRTSVELEEGATLPEEGFCRFAF
jgi:hypothetical protein